MITYDNFTSGGNVSPGTSLTWSHTCAGGGRLLLVFMRGGNGEGDKVTGVTYAGVAMTKLGSTVTVGGGSNQVMSGYYLINPAIGANNVVVSLSSGYIQAASVSYKNVRQTGFPDSINTNSATSASSLTVSTTTVKNNCWTVLFGKGSSITAGTGSTSRGVNSDTRIFDSNGVITPAGSTNMSFTNSVDDVGGIIVSFAPQLYSPIMFFQ